MQNTITINFNVTPTQKETIASRAIENGFDDISAYIKVLALKIDSFTLTSAGASTDEASVMFEITVTAEQNETIQTKAKENKCDDIQTYLRYIALHGVISAVVEVRSTGNLEAMLERIANSRK